MRCLQSREVWEIYSVFIHVILDLDALISPRNEILEEHSLMLKCCSQVGPQGHSYMLTKPTSTATWHVTYKLRQEGNVHTFLSLDNCSKHYQLLGWTTLFQEGAQKSAMLHSKAKWSKGYHSNLSELTNVVIWQPLQKTRLITTRWGFNAGCQETEISLIYVQHEVSSRTKLNLRPSSVII